MTRPDCPGCGSTLVVPVERGTPAGDEVTLTHLDGPPVDASPDDIDDWACGDCGLRWLDVETAIRAALDEGGQASGDTTQIGEGAPEKDPGAESAASALRRARERRGLALAEVATATRVWERHLRGLEQGKSPEAFGGLAYARFFLREYAQFLGLDADALVRAYEERHPSEDGPEPPIEPMPDPRRRVKLTGRIASMAALIALAALLLGPRLVAGEDARPSLPPSTPGTGSSPAVATTTPPPPADDPLRRVRAVLVVHAPSWVEAVVDGRPTVARTIGSGERLVLTGYRAVVLRLGNAGGVSLRVGGDPVPTGEPGEVLDLTLRLRDGVLKISRG